MNWRERTKEHEGIRLKAYVDTVGKITIGYGRNLTDRGISMTMAETMFDEDCRAAMLDVGRAMQWMLGLDEIRKGVLYEMCYNIGINRLLTFKNMIAACRVKDYETAAAEMLDSKWAQQVGQRAITLATIMRKGTET